MSDQLLINGDDIEEVSKVLWTSVMNGSLKMVEQLLKDGADINTIDNSYWHGGMSLLHFAVHVGRMEMVKLLLTYGANINIKNNDGATPIFFAVRNGNAEMTKQLLINGADIKDDHKALCTAVKNRRLKIVTDLLKYGADANVIDHSYWCGPVTLLHIAVYGEQLEMAKVLLKHGANVSATDRHGSTPLLYALENKDKRMMDILFTNGASIEEGNPRILWTAVDNGYLNIVTKLLKNGADANMIDKSHWFGGMTLLHVATHAGHVKMAKLLLFYGANINVENADGDTPILLAIRKEDRKMVRMLLIHGADITGDPKIQSIAIEKGNFKIVKDLLQFSADVNMRDDSESHGMSLLHIAVLERHVKIAKLLLNYGANVNVKNNMGESPIRLAILRRDKRMVELLYNNGADIREDPSILGTAVKNGSLIIVENLLQDAAVLDMIDNLYWNGGMTLLHTAVREWQEEMAKLLLRYGANVNVKDILGKTVIDDAIYIGESGYTGMAELLLINGADTKDVNISLLPPESATAEILKQHIAKLKALGLYVTEKNLLWIKNSYEMNEFLKKCEAEIREMKRKKIGNSCATFYDILRERRRQLGNNKSVVRVLKSETYKKKFPIYASMIDNQFRKGVEREELLKPFRNQFTNSLTESKIKLPFVCTEKILSYLKDRDLRIFKSKL